MSSPPFRMEAYLKLCRQLFDEARLEMADRQRRLDSLLSKRAALVGQKEAAAAELDSYMSHSICAGALEENYRYAAWLDGQLTDLDSELVRMQTMVEEQNQAVVEANIELKKFEKLKEKAAEKDNSGQGPYGLPE